MVRSAWPTCVSVACWPRMTLAFFSARSTNGIIGSMASCRGAATLGTSPSPPCRPRTFFVSTSTLSFTSGNAWALPISAWDTDLASRCDCISA